MWSDGFVAISGEALFDSEAEAAFANHPKIEKALDKAFSSDVILLNSRL